jgi:hypothetical protein
MRIGLVWSRSHALLANLLIVALVKDSRSFLHSHHVLKGSSAHLHKRSQVLLVAGTTRSSISVQEFLTDDLSEEIAKEVSSSVVVPSPVIKYVVEQALRHLSSDLSVSTMESLQQLLRAAKTTSRYDDVNDVKEIHALADTIAMELNPNIDIPVLNEDQELLVLQQIMRMVLSAVASNKKDQHQRALIQTSVDLMGSPQDQDKLVKTIHAKCNLPFVDDTQQEKVIRMAVEASAGVVSSILPPDLVQVLRRESPNGIVKMKEYVVTAINSKVDIVGLSKEQQRMLVEKLVDILIDEYLADGTDTEYVLLGNTDIDEQEEYWLVTKARLQREQTLSRLRFEREQKNLALQLETVQQRIQSVRQKRPFFRRIVGRILRWRPK